MELSYGPPTTPDLYFSIYQWELGPSIFRPNLLLAPNPSSFFQRPFWGKICRVPPCHWLSASVTSTALEVSQLIHECHPTLIILYLLLCEKWWGGVWLPSRPPNTTNCKFIDSPSHSPPSACSRRTPFACPRGWQPVCPSLYPSRRKPAPRLSLVLERLPLTPPLSLWLFFVFRFYLIIKKENKS